MRRETRPRSHAQFNDPKERLWNLTGDAASWMARARRRLALTAKSNQNENLKDYR